MKHIRAFLALAMIAGITPAVAQTFPTVPGRSVIGRLGIQGDTGPSQAIPFSKFLSELGGAQAANTVWAGPTSGLNASPTFRALVGTDVPPINLAAGNVNGGVTGVTPIANGGSNGATKQAGFDNLAPTATRAGDVIYWNGTHWVTLAGNNSGTQILTENSSGVPSWAATGSVSSVTCGTFMTGGTITTTGTCNVTAVAKSDQTTGTSNVLAVTPLHQQDHDSASKAWGTFTAAGCSGSCTIQSSYNITSVTRVSAGLYTVAFTTAFAAATYGCVITSEQTAGGAVGIIGYITSGSRTTTQFQISTNTTTDAVSYSFDCHGRQ